MAGHTLRSALIDKDKQACYDIVSSKLVGQSLIGAIHEMILASISVIYDGKLMLHPVCVINSIKNFIGDNRHDPSISLMRFAIDYLFEFDLRDNDSSTLDDIVKNGLGDTVFVGDLEDACQNSDWEKAEAIMSKTFLASDRSRATLDTLIELALQNAPTHAIFVYHILRSYQFQESKNENWAFIKCVFEQISSNGLDNAHASIETSPSDIRENVIQNGDVVYFSAIDNIWNGEYVRSRGYKRELSYWLSKITLKGSSKIELLDGHFLKDQENLSFTMIAQEIIKKEKTQEEKAQDLVILEAVRSLAKITNNQEILYLGSRYNHLAL